MKGLVRCSAQVPLPVFVMSETNWNTCMCTETRTRTQTNSYFLCLHTVSGTPAVKHNTLIFRTARAGWLLHGEERCALTEPVTCCEDEQYRRQEPEQFDCQASNHNATIPQSLCVRMEGNNGRSEKVQPSPPMPACICQKAVRDPGPHLKNQNLRDFPVSFLLTLDNLQTFFGSKLCRINSQDTSGGKWGKHTLKYAQK